MCKGDSIAMIIPESTLDFSLELVSELPQSIRGSGGFGSTGVSSGENNKIYSKGTSSNINKDNIIQYIKQSDNAVDPIIEEQCNKFIMFSASDVKIPANGKGIVPTDLSTALPDNTYGRVGKIRAHFSFAG